MENLKRFYVYVDKRLSNRKVFYVGKGSGNRFKEPYRDNIHWMRIVRKEKGCSREIVKSNLTEREAHDEEIRLIKLYGRKNLANFTAGGEGSSGRVCKPSTREKISNGNKGKVRSVAHVQAIVKANTGRKQSAETVAKNVAYHTGRKRSAETCAKIGLTSTGRIKSEATKLKLSKALKGRKFTDEHKNKMSESSKRRARGKGGKFI